MGSRPEKNYHQLIKDSDELRRIEELTITDVDAALRIARKIEIPFYRGEAIASVAEHANYDRTESLARESFNAARQSDDGYVKVAAACFALSILLKRKHYAMARDLLQSTLAAADAMESIVNRSDALVSLYGAIRNSGDEMRKPVLDRLIKCAVSESSWRCARNLAWVAVALSEHDFEAATKLVEFIRNGKYKRMALKEIDK